MPKKKIETPCNFESEQIVLAAMLQSQNVCIEAVSQLEADDFFKTTNRAIFNAISDMCAAGRDVDTVSLIDWLNSKSQLAAAGGDTGVLQILDAPMPLMTWETHVEILKREAAQRHVLEAVNRVYDLTQIPPTRQSEYVSEVERIILEATEQSVPNEYSEMAEAIERFAEYKETVDTKGVRATAVMSNYRDLDAVLGGFKPGEVEVIAARPAMGKTTFALNLALNMAGSGTKVCFFSLEMPETELVARLVSAASTVPLDEVNGPTTNRNYKIAISETFKQLKTLPIAISDQPEMSIADIRANARRMLRGYKGKAVIIIDYLQLIAKRGGAENQNVAIGEISRGLKLLAKQLNVPVIALSQLSRAIESRPDKRPQLSDLRDSGSIEQDADKVMFLDRSKDAEEAKRPDRPKEEHAWIRVEKNRQGATGKVTLVFKPKQMRFYTIEKYKES